MNENKKERARELMDAVKKAGLNAGVVVQQGIAVLRYPGSPYRDEPTRFDEDDLFAAVERGLLTKTKVTGSLTWEWYIVVSTSHNSAS